MKIAFISYEYPPDTAIGGIGTYVYQAAQMMQLRGHTVEVFAGSPERTGTYLLNRIRVHRVRTTDRRQFPQAIAAVFIDRHAIVQFDVLEGPELGAEAAPTVQRVAEIPYVVKLHTPSFLIGKMNHVQPSFALQLRRWLGAMRRGQWPTPFPTWQYDAAHDPERQNAIAADLITTPSQSLSQLVAEAWGLPQARIFHLPNPYIPSPALLDIPVQTCTQTVTFLGRLEIRKGVLDLAAAIPLILKRCPTAKFRFVGAAWNSPQPGLNMRQYLTRQLHRSLAAVEFCDPVALDLIPTVLAATDICVFPSRWENFPNVCLEAMAAARGIVASNAGGMVEMLDFGQCGHLVSPQQPQQIATAVIELLQNPDRRIQFGQQARDRVLNTYHPDQLAALQEASYQQAIEHQQCKKVLYPARP